MRIAILGTRGVPANYGGFETFAEECAVRLVQRGHQVTVYCRSHYVPPGLSVYRGIELAVLPTLRWKYTDTVAHAFLSSVHALFRRFDVVVVCNAANAIFSWIPRLVGTATLVNVDGLERLRSKWNWCGRAWYQMSERLAVWLPNAIVTDARVIQQYYRERYGADSAFIPYGARRDRVSGTGILEQLGLSSRDYYLYVSRLEPENNAHRVIAAFSKVRTARKLVIVGDAPYAHDYIRRLRSTEDPRVIFPGGIYGDRYVELQGNAFCYIHATEVGGTHPALLEAMGQAGLVVANGTPENIESLGDAGILYPRNDEVALALILQQIEDAPEKYEPLRAVASERARVSYSWDDVVDQYERLFLNTASGLGK
jgi:glycosyltransferase involved in cell wall biosynthesis